MADDRDRYLPDITEGARVDALLAIERSRQEGRYDEEQIARLHPLVMWLRAAAGGTQNG